ncbi:MAG: hypothetical protein A2218_10115 [Elusimicrobia bacterium RIFOXYA2_FULL_53_38]|nr:MAG: hypothetical protein A2218_10115 [Elusimicrobia bacterium RIFOXYA2_FULL_53_38]
MKPWKLQKSAKKRGWKSCLPLLFFVLSWLPFSVPLPIPSPQPVFSAVPVKFTYQGNLRQAGFLVNGVRSIEFNIYDSSTSAVPLWSTPAPMSVQFSTGVFRVTLEPTLNDWETGNLWLELVIEGTPLSPREEITSSPYAVNSLLFSGKRYTSSDSAPLVHNTGDFWMDTSANTLKFWNGAWTAISAPGGILPGSHADTHDLGGTDPILNLGPHNVSGAITFDTLGELRVSGGVTAITIAANAIVQGTLNPASNLAVGGAGYTVTFASSVSAGWFHGDGYGLSNLDASKITSGYLNSNRIAAGVIVSTHIADKTIDKVKLASSGCADSNVLKWNIGTAQWECAVDNTSGGLPGVHAATHDLGGVDPIQNLGPHDVSGPITFDTLGELRVSGAVTGITIAANAIVQGTLNPASNLAVGGAGYAVTFASSVSAGWFRGDGYALSNLDASKITSGYLNSDRIAAGVIVSTHIANNSITRLNLSQSGCANGQTLKWNNGANQWTCSDDFGDNLGSHIATTTLQMGNFGIVNVASIAANGYITTNSTMTVIGDAFSVGISTFVVTQGNIGIGTVNPGAKLEVAGQVKITGGSPAAGKVLTSDAAGLAAWQSVTTDNLGNHIATTTLQMGNFGIVNVASIAANGYITTNSTMTVLGDAFSVGTSTFVVTQGNIGIGMLNPAYSLDVNGDVRAINFRGNGSLLTGLGGLGGVTNPGNTNIVADNDSDGSGQITLSIGLADSMVILNNGNIGIGAAVPGAKLEVAGQIKITGGSPAAGKVLTSDAAGLAAWQDVPVATDNLGNHIATTTLQMSNFGIVNVASITANGYITTNSTMTVLGDAFSVGTSTFVVKQGNIGIGTENPGAKLEVTGEENPGQYIAVFNSGSKVAAWLRNK